ncbi:glutamate receptor-like [Penaeus japonicus]|uniref:glutamate receptor-like n=1 Tax=Penaeus japonicus TaxID=27405 RepID=UPI001C70EDA6|nr:glutamate receptor-like [Penaeus japonicus]
MKKDCQCREMSLGLEAGGSVMYFPISSGPNMTDGLTQSIEHARTVRQLSWCTSVVVLSDDPAFLASFSELILRSRLVLWSTKLLVVTRTSLQELRHLYATFSVMNAMLMLLRHDGISLFVNLPYDPSEAQVRVASFTRQRGLVLRSDLKLFPEKFKKLSWSPSFVVVAEEYRPHVVIENTAPGDPVSVMGPMVNLLSALAEGMNFSYSFVRPPDGSWGTKMENGSWTGMVGVVTRNTTTKGRNKDISIPKDEGCSRQVYVLGMTLSKTNVNPITCEAQLGLGPFGITPSRNEVIEYTTPILIDYIRIMAGRGRLEVDPWGFLFPLTAGVWAALLASLLLVSASTFLLSATTPKVLSVGGGSSRDYFGYFRVLLQQDESVVGEPGWRRLVAAAWMIATLVIVRSYAGNLMSLLAVRHIPQPFQSLRAVLDDADTGMIWEANTAYVQYLNVSAFFFLSFFLSFFFTITSRLSVKSGTFHEVLQAGRRGRIKYLRSTEIPAAVDTWVRSRKDVLLIEDLTARIYMGQDVTDTGRCDFYTSRDVFLPLIFAMIGQKNSPLIPVISDKITRLTEGGVYEHWMKTSIPNSTVCAQAPSKITVNTSLTLTNLWGVFAVLGGGLTVALLVLCLEVTARKQKQAIEMRPRQQQY